MTARIGTNRRHATAGRRFRVLGVLAAVLLLAGCGGNDALPRPAANSDALTGTGPITLAMGKDVTGTLNSILATWNKAHPDQTVTLIELPSAADQQREQMVLNAQSHSDAYTIYSLDVVWTSEFAANGWIDPLPAHEFPLAAYLPPVLKTAKYRGTLYAAPYASDGALLYSRTDLLSEAGITTPPRTWAELSTDCDAVLALPDAKGMSCYAGQFGRYEGLTVNFSEAVDSAGGRVIDSAGRPAVDTTAAAAGLNFLVNGVRDGLIPKAALTWDEAASQKAFDSGRLVFMRNWPYCYNLMLDTNDTTNKVAGRFGVSQIPGLDGPGEGTLGGHDLAINKYAEHRQTALNFIRWFTSQSNERVWLTKNSQAPVYSALYDDPALRHQFPYLATLKKSLLHAEPRPAIVDYSDATAAIQEQAYDAISGSKPTAAALRDLQRNLARIATNR